MPKTRFCRTCEEPLPEDASSARKFCNDRCRVRYHKEKKALGRKGGLSAHVTPAIKNFRELVKYTDIEDPKVFVREILQDAIRENITQAVNDNLLGAGEALTGMLPSVLAGLQRDLESKDWMIRSRAQAAVLKYAFEFRDKNGKDEDLGTINVIHNMAVPNTPLGEAIVTEYEVIEEEQKQLGVEAFEKDWPKCRICHERKHPDAMRTDNMCSSCRLAYNYRSGTRQSDPMTIYSASSPDPEFSPNH